MKLVSVETFWVDGRLIVAGESVDAEDSVVKGREHLFTSPPRDAAPVVEEATAEPGRRRRTVKPKD